MKKVNKKNEINAKNEALKQEFERLRQEVTRCTNQYVNVFIRLPLFHKLDECKYSGNLTNPKYKHPFDDLCLCVS